MMISIEEEDVMFVCEVISVGRLIKEDHVSFTDTIRRQINDVIWKFEEAETIRPQLHAEKANYSKVGLIIPTLHNVEFVQTNQSEVQVRGSRRLEDEEPIEMNQEDDIFSRSGNFNANHPEDVEQQPQMWLTTVERFPGSSDGRRPFRHRKNYKNQIDKTEKPGHECPECQKIFKTKAHLKSHSSTHLNEETRKKIRDSWKFQCCFGVCKKKFPCNSALQNHQLCHLDTKDYKCTECDKHFQTPISMMQHRKVHKADCPNKCFFCNKKFYQKANLDNHLKTHTGEMGFKCEICPKEFPQKAHLKSHVAFIHEKRRPHQCLSCLKKFSSKQVLVRHVHAIHPKPGEPKSEEIFLH